MEKDGTYLLLLTKSIVKDIRKFVTSGHVVDANLRPDYKKNPFSENQVKFDVLSELSQIDAFLENWTEAGREDFVSYMAGLDATRSFDDDLGDHAIALDNLRNIIAELSANMSANAKYDIPDEALIHMAILGEYLEFYDYQKAHDLLMLYAKHEIKDLESKEITNLRTISYTFQIYENAAVRFGDLEAIALARTQCVAVEGAILENIEKGVVVYDTFYRMLERAVEAVTALSSGPMRTSLEARLLSSAATVGEVRLAVLKLVTLAKANSASVSDENSEVRSQFPDRFLYFPDMQEMASAIDEFAREKYAYLQLNEEARFCAGQSNAPQTAGVGWLDFKIDYGEHRRVVPLLKSLLDEEKFEQHLILYLHELTHVSCFAGGIGFYLNSLGAWLTWTETVLRATCWGSDRRVFPPVFTSDNPMLLAFFEHQTEICTRISVVQEVWRPWIEGLAVIAETVLDPRDDNIGYSKIWSMLLAYMDFVPESGESNRKAAYHSHLQNVERISSPIMRRASIQRLRELFGSSDGALYSSGFLMVHEVLASLSNSTSRKYTRATLFPTLLNATTYGVYDYLPDPSLPIEEFESEAEEKFLLFFRRMCDLNSEEISLIIDIEDSDSPGNTIFWNNGIPSRINKKDPPIHGGSFERVKRLFGLGDPFLRFAQREYNEKWKELFESTSSVVDMLLHYSHLDSYDGEKIEAMIRQHVFGNSQLNMAAKGGSSTISKIHQSMLIDAAMIKVGAVECQFHAFGTGNKNEKGFLFLPLVTSEKLRDKEGPRASVVGLQLPNFALNGLKEQYDRRFDPLMHVVRFIDLIPPRDNELLEFTHFLLLKYGEWSWVMPTNPGFDDLLSIASRNHLKSKACARFFPEIGKVSIDSRKAMAEKIISDTKHVEMQIPDWGRVDLSRWKDAIISNNSRTLAAGWKSGLRSRVSGRALRLLGYSDEASSSLSEEGVWALTESERYLRDELLEQLAATARGEDIDQRSFGQFSQEHLLEIFKR